MDANEQVRDMADVYPKESWWRPGMGAMRIYEVTYSPYREEVTLVRRVRAPCDQGESNIEERVIVPVEHERYQRVVDGIKTRFGRVGQRAEREAYLRFRSEA